VITVSTDGSCLRNPGGASGWAWVNHDGTSGSGGVASGTNQIAELMAVREAIGSHPGTEPLQIESDSQYAIKCASVWVAGWKRKGWRTASGGPVQNLAVVQAIERAIAERPGPVAFSWVRGHVGNEFNERADELAGQAARRALSGVGCAPAAAPAEPDLLF
jgi:ribonuclease HI